MPASLSAEKLSAEKGRQDSFIDKTLQASLQQMIMQHIEQYKTYPYIARKRHIQGKVKVSFDLQADGQIKNLILEGRHSILVRASRKAVKLALPMPMQGIDSLTSRMLPLKLSFYMDYQLQ